MKRINLLLILITALLISSTNIFAIDRVAARYNAVGFQFSAMQPVGSYKEFGIGVNHFEFDGGDGRYFEIDGSDLYKNASSFAISYGTLINDNMFYSIGFLYGDVKHKKRFEDEVYIYSYTDELNLRLYNIDFNYNYHFTSPVESGFSPFVGVGFQAGIYTVGVQGFDSESSFNYSLGLNFGADIKLMENKNSRSFIALSSMNSYQLSANEYRPKYLTIGGAIKYYFRPF